MGCQCGNNTYDKFSIDNILSQNISNISEIKSEHKISDYVKKVFFLINKVRTNPSYFADVVDYYQQYIIEKNDRKIFSHKVNVYLNEGAPMFQDCSDYLRKLEPMNELTFSDEIVLDCPTDPENIRDMDYFKQKVCEKEKKEKIEAYFKDSIKEPEISVLLMIVDDSVRNPRRKRETVLNKRFTKIGISASDVGGGSTGGEEGGKIGGGCVDNGNNNNNGNVNTSGQGDGKSNNNYPFCAYFSFK